MFFFHNVSQRGNLTLPSVSFTKLKKAFHKLFFCVVRGSGNCKANVNVHKNIYDQGPLINIGMSNAFCLAFHQAHENTTNRR